MNPEKILKDIEAAAAKLVSPDVDETEARWASNIISARCRDLTDWAAQIERKIEEKK